MTETFALVVGHTLFQGFRKFSPTEAWTPSINVYQLHDRVEVAVDLAGIRREQIDVRVEPGRLLIRGVRNAPEPPTCESEEAERSAVAARRRSGAGEEPTPPRDPADPGCEGQPMRIVTMEIDYGPFSRSIAIPDNVDLRKVSSEYREGILWVTLPLRLPGRRPPR